MQEESAECAVDLLHAFNYIALALNQAAAYINRRAYMTILSYLNEFRASDKRRENLLHWDAGDLRRDKSASNSVLTAWLMSFDHIWQERSPAADLLSLMSFFNPQVFPKPVLREYGRAAAGPEYDAEANGMFDEDFDTLQAYSLVTAMAELDLCKMHPLVPFCT